jgi:ABC-type branched-subunit amino acid transport system ATPase component
MPALKLPTPPPVFEKGKIALKGEAARIAKDEYVTKAYLGR